MSSQPRALNNMKVVSVMSLDTLLPTRSKVNFLDRFFEISARGSTVATEIRGGLVTFLTMVYIIVLNPLIIGTTTDSTGQYLGGGTHPHLAAISAVTALVACVMSILMGAVARFPLALATGLGLNAFVAYGIAKMPGMTWADAMGMVVWEGIVILILVLTGFRTAVFRAVPRELKTAIGVGIGLFIAFIGFVDSGFVRAGSGTPVTLGIGGTLKGWPTVVFAFGLCLIIALMVRKKKGAILIGILAATVLAIVIEALWHVGSQTDATGKMVNPAGWSLNVPALPNSLIAVPDFRLIGHISLFGAFGVTGPLGFFMGVFVLSLSDLFDTMGTMTAIGAEAGLLDKLGMPPRAREIFIVDAIAAAVGGYAGVSSNTAYIESASGVGEGARTGLASVVTGICFLLSTFLAPLVTMVPYEAATPALVVVGLLMMQQLSGINWRDFEIAVPAGLTILLMPFSYSITAGIGAGFVSYVFLKAVRGKARDVHPLMWVVATAFVVFFAKDLISRLLGVQ